MPKLREWLDYRRQRRADRRALRKERSARRRTSGGDMYAGAKGSGSKRVNAPWGGG